MGGIFLYNPDLSVLSSLLFFFFFLSLPCALVTPVNSPAPKHAFGRMTHF